MQINLHTKTIDHHLRSALEEGGTNGSVFKWYLAMQGNDARTYHPEKYAESEGLLPYPGINLPTAPKSNFYAHEKDYAECHVSQGGLSRCKNPSLNIQLRNCMKPQSLHWAKHEQMITAEVIENCPLHTQQTYRKNHLAEQNVSADFDIGQSFKSEVSNAASNLPTNIFVDTTVENTAKAVEMIL